MQNAPKSKPIRKSLFLTYEGISNTIFDSQVALHSKEMKPLGLAFEILTFETWPKLFAISKSRISHAKQISNSEVYLRKGVFNYLPLSSFLNSILLLIHLIFLKSKIDFIHARSDFATSTCFFAKKILKIPIIWDCRGDSYAEFEQSFIPKSFLQKVFKAIYLKQILLQKFFAGYICDKAIFVSELLYERNKSFIKSKHYEIIPTSASSLKFFFSPDLRRKMREKLNFNSDELVILYSGGMTGYQGFESIVDFISNIEGTNPRLKFLVLTPDIEKASNKLKERLPQSKFALLSVPFSQMNEYYNAADYGILIRKKDRINDVASPTKFSEYCLTGLKVIMNDSVDQSYKYAEKLGNLIDITNTTNFCNNKQVDDAYRYNIAANAKEILSREANLPKYQHIYNFK